MDADARREISQKAAAARWEKAQKVSTLPEVILKGQDLDLAGMRIPCAIAESSAGGEPLRVITDRGLNMAMFGNRSGAAIAGRRLSKEAGAELPLFWALQGLRPFVDAVFGAELPVPIEYVENGQIMLGYDATILPAVCEVWLMARAEGALLRGQMDKAQYNFCRRRRTLKATPAMAVGLMGEPMSVRELVALT